MTSIDKFAELVDKLVKDVHNDCLVLHTDKSYSLSDQEASFSIRIRFRKDSVEPDKPEVVEPK